jgi:hypothetical protein
VRIHLALYNQVAGCYGCVVWTAHFAVSCVYLQVRTRGFDLGELHTRPFPVSSFLAGLTLMPFFQQNAISRPRLTPGPASFMPLH